MLDTDRRARYTDGNQPASGDIVPPAGGGPDLCTEIQALKQLSTAHRSELVRDFALSNREDS
ncbi:hypothetical protein ACIRQP_34020 [Streptomyces sp. NPDC102274]|uniref:hypothetical protein n=1 Tax=Streptomyces sp. NPDC102274 TaxID=3366151 RepID=UPI003823D819